MLTDHFEAVGPRVEGKVFLQYGLRSAVEDNAGVMAADLGASKVLLFARHEYDTGPVAERISRKGCEVEIVDVPLETIILTQDKRACDVSFCDDVLFRVDDPYRLLAGLRSVTRDRLIISTCVVPSVGPEDSIERPWPIQPEFQAYSGSFSDVEANDLYYVFSTLKLDVAGFLDFDRTLIDPDTGHYVPSALWRWFWTESVLLQSIRSAGFSIKSARYIWNKIGILVECY